MIAELFYPKELKEIIADLRAKGDLNEEAVKAIRYTPYVFGALWLVVFVIIFISDPGLKLTVFLGAGGLLLAAFFAWLTNQTTFTRMKSYLYGTREKGKVLGIYSAYPASAIKIKIQNITTSDVVYTGVFTQWYHTKECPKCGEEIYYYSIGKRIRHNMPDRTEVKILYCLSKRILRAKEKAPYEQ
jgi:hypothetical protein